MDEVTEICISESVKFVKKNSETTFEDTVLLISNETAPKEIVEELRKALSMGLHCKEVVIYPRWHFYLERHHGDGIVVFVDNDGFADSVRPFRPVD